MEPNAESTLSSAASVPTLNHLWLTIYWIFAMSKRFAAATSLIRRTIISWNGVAVDSAIRFIGTIGTKFAECGTNESRPRGLSRESDRAYADAVAFRQPV